MRDERRIFVLTLMDGAQAVVLLTLLPFILLRDVSSQPSAGITGAGSLSAGFFLGIAGTLIVGRAADKWSPYAVLQLIQVLQVLTSVALLLSFILDLHLVNAFLVVLSIGMLRSSGPAKDKVRALHIARDRRTSFNALSRRWFLVVNQALVVAVTIAISFLPEILWPYLLLSSTLLVCASIGLIRTLSAGENAISPAVESSPARFSSGQALRLVVAFLIIIILGLGSAIPSIGLTAWISLHNLPEWILSIFGVYLVLFDFWFIKFIGARVSDRPRRWNRVIQGGAVALIVGVVSAWAVSLLTPGWPAHLLLFALMPAVVAAASISTMFAMEIQYGFAVDSLRGRIASYTRVCSAVSIAIASFIAPALFLDGVVTVIVILLLAAFVLLFCGPALRRIDLQL